MEGRPSLPVLVAVATVAGVVTYILGMEVAAATRFLQVPGFSKDKPNPLSAREEKRNSRSVN